MGPTRVTFGWLSARNVARATSARSRIATLERQGLSGKRIERASDAPDEWMAIERLQARQGELATFGANAANATDVLNAADRTLGDAANVIKRAWELAVGAASEAAGTDYIDAAAIEIRSIKTSLVSLANREYAGRALFAGTAYDGAAFDAAGTYIGANDVATVRVGEVDTATVGFDGAEVFQGGEDIFALLDDAAAAMDARDSDAVAALLGRFEAAHEQIVDHRTVVGVEQARVADLAETNANLESIVGELVSNKVEIDEISVYTQLASLRTTYEATLQIASQSMTPTLFQMMR